ncbi:MAG: type II CAAX endopeptidase family protein [Candidatus Wallbacteria bacterium]|nr:type II CAAX endopeptidase family protein [Candidatus Wallbacteria bacterium]
MIWKCPCGEVNLGLAEFCRNCENKFCPDYIIKQEKKSVIPEVRNKAAEAPDSVTFSDIFMIILYSFIFMILMSILSHYIKYLNVTFAEFVKQYPSYFFILWIAYRRICVKYNKTFIESFALYPVSSDVIKSTVLTGIVWALSNIALGFFLPYQSENTFIDEYWTERLTSRLAFATLLFLVPLLVPMVEEFLFRGILYQAMIKLFSPGKTIVIVGLLFGLIHVPQHYPNVYPIVNMAAMGIMLTYLRYRYNSLVPPLILHVVNNSVATFIMFACLFSCLILGIKP